MNSGDFGFFVCGVFFLLCCFRFFYLVFFFYYFFFPSWSLPFCRIAFRHEVPPNTVSFTDGGNRKAVPDHFSVSVTQDNMFQKYPLCAEKEVFGG